MNDKLPVNAENKFQHGELFTPKVLIDEMIGLFPESLFENPNLRWLDPGCGKGQFSAAVYTKLDLGLQTCLPNDSLRRAHILEKMLYMVELNDEHEDDLVSQFGLGANIIMGDYLDHDFGDIQFDIILGNPPYNFGGVKKVPTNKTLSKVYRKIGLIKK